MKSLSQCRPRLSVDHAVMEALVQFADGHEVCDPSLYELSQITGFSRRSVCRAIKDLMTRRVLVFSHRYAADGCQLSNEYLLIDGAGEIPK